MASSVSIDDRIYLDHNATTPVDEAVMEAMLPWLKAGYGNASSIHAEGRAARGAIDRARTQVAELLGSGEDEVYFTSGGTESNNLAVFGAVESAGGGSLIASRIEHHAVLRPMELLQRRGRALHLLETDGGGLVDPDELERELDERGDVLLVSVILANNEVGAIQDIGRIAEVCVGRDVLLHTDAVQAAGKLPLDVSSLPVDLLSISGHKIYGPKGAGALYVRRGVKLAAQLLGGSHERRLRAGTENVPGIVGLGEACRLAAEHLDGEVERIAGLRDRLWDGLSSGLDGVHRNGDSQQALCNTLNVSFEGVEGEALLLNLDMAGIACSSGSACASGSLEPSHVLTAMGVPPELAQSAVRFSLGRGNTESQIDRAVEEVVRVVSRLRSMQFSF